MSKKWATEKKWVDLMTRISWKGIEEWGIVDSELVLKEVPFIEDWARRHINDVPYENVRAAFRKFFTTDQAMTQNDYTLKNQAMVALGTLYNVLEQTDGRS